MKTTLQEKINQLNECADNLEKFIFDLESANYRFKQLMIMNKLYREMNEEKKEKNNG